MAEAVVSFVVEKLGNLLIQEGILLYGVRDQAEWVEGELRWMQCFLKDADAKQRKGDERVKNWVREVTHVAYQAEDAIDTFMLQVERRRRLQGFAGFIKRYAIIPSTLIARHKVGKEIERIQIKIDEISKKRDTYGIANLGEIGGDLESLEARRRVSPNLNDDTDSIVGFYVYGKMAVSQLLDTKTKRRCIISIVGMGGLGKTTLAQKIFKSTEIMANFPIRIWVTVSQDYQVLELLKSIARIALGTSTEELQRMNEEEVKEKLHEFLNEKVYFIVMDDIWGTDVWKKINKVLPDVMNGSRVLITTRFKEVANSADPGVQPLMLPLLNEEESLELFTKKVFPASSCPEELEVLARQMVRKCSGLPLALVVLGGILSKKLHTPLVWQKVYENMNWESTEDGKECLKILALSYNNLPNHLKSCFLYMGSFPEDSEICGTRLARLWIAEGFVPQGESETMEDTASGYLEELAQRSMIQVAERSRYDGGISRCRIHDLLRDMCLGEAKQVGFLNVIHCSSSSNDSSVSVSRRLALLNPSLTEDTENNYRRYLKSNPNLRSLIITDYFTESQISLYGLKLLRVLVANGPDVISLKMVKEMASMTHLRYLELAGSRMMCIIKIPSSILRFRYLQTLILRRGFIIEGGGELELPNLRHLSLTNDGECCPSIAMSTKLQTLENLTNDGECCPSIAMSTKLQTLENIHCDKTWIERNLPRLTNLRRLSMHLYFEGDANTLYAALGKLRLLASLKLIAFTELSAEAILTALAQNLHIYNLELDGAILERRLPTCSVFPRNLTKLRLVRSELEQDPMPVLEKLPYLMFLDLSFNAYVGEEIVCTTGGFPRLQELEFGVLWEMQRWIVEVGSFPNLTSLQIWGCTKLSMLPDGLQYVSSLKKLEVDDSRREFRDKLQGDDWFKIKHVPSIHISDY